MASDLESLNAVAMETVRNAGRDPRLVFVRVRASTSGAWTCECSDADVLAGVVQQLNTTASRPVTAVRLPDTTLHGLAAWVVASVAEVRRTPSHHVEQVTQALQGEILQPLLHEDGWLLCRLADGYVGWVRDWHVQLVATSIAAGFAVGCDARIAIPWLQLREAARPDAGVAGETVHGTRVRCGPRQDGWVEIELPGGRRGWVPETALRAGGGDWPFDIAAVLATALGYRGVPYLWGGKSPKGFDCSGLVQFTFGLHGVALPRDADQQALAGVESESRAAGDLLYFGRERVTHIGVMLDASRFVHARGEVRLNSLAPGTPDYDAELCALVRGARRVRPPIG